MKGRSLIIPVVILFALVSCNKGYDEPYTLKFFGDAFEDIGYSIGIADDGYVITGQLTEIERSDGNYIASSDRNLCVLKTGWDGNLIWKLTAGGSSDDHGSKICVLSDGSYICTGTFTDPIDNTTDIIAVKVSSAGNIEWQRSYGGPGNQAGLDVIEVAGGFMVLGSTDTERLPFSDSTGNIAGRTDLYLLRLTQSGDSSVSYAYGYPGNDLGAVLKEDPDGGFILLGTTDRSEPGQDGNNILLVRINDAGNAVESRIIGGTDDEYAGDLEIVSDGYFISGTKGAEGTQQSILLDRLGKNIFGPSAQGFPKEITVSGLSSGVMATTPTAYGTFILAGRSGTGSSSDMLFLEVDEEGTIVGDHQLIKGSTGNQTAYDIAEDADGYLVAVGKNSYDANSMISFLKFRF